MVQHARRERTRELLARRKELEDRLARVREAEERHRKKLELASRSFKKMVPLLPSAISCYIDDTPGFMLTCYSESTRKLDQRPERKTSSWITTRAVTRRLDGHRMIPAPYRRTRWPCWRD